MTADQTISVPSTTRVAVRYFAAAAEAAAREEETLEVPVGPPAGAIEGGTVDAIASATATVGDLRGLLVQRYGDDMARVLASGSFLVDGVVSRDDARTLGARVDVLPPFAGG
ncbi:molybdopterin converting factor small subunit [Glaciihabitans tibetensis]|uniref:Molybdopterin converting factor small subunit n=1 Tax=Glaciihabitans tibetensis TaxID=1266600 RepID=A0A2T0VFR0_9MICO|nr:MoaD/ThiS family protein [Glaciihabitans tibetensis]PRY69035.1 molybdopterin converting factor small subunit [Glaciihabitans tibetensis]